MNVFHTIGTKTVPISHLTSKSQLSTPEKITLFSPSFRMDKLSHFSSKQLSIWPGRKLAIPSTVLPSILCPPPSLHINIHSTGRERGEGQTDTCLRTPEKPRSFVAAPFSSFDEKRTVRMDWRERGTIVLIEREVNSRRTSSESYRHSVVFSLDPFPSLPDRQTTNTCWVSLCDVLFVFLRFCKIYT